MAETYSEACDEWEAVEKNQKRSAHKPNQEQENKTSEPISPEDEIPVTFQEGLIGLKAEAEDLQAATAKLKESQNTAVSSSGPFCCVAFRSPELTPDMQCDVDFILTLTKDDGCYDGLRWARTRMDVDQCLPPILQHNILPFVTTQFNTSKVQSLWISWTRGWIVRTNCKPPNDPIVPFINTRKIHFDILRSIYRGLRPHTQDVVPRFGSHWETIGFQGDDPATDLRGVGMLGCVHLLGLVSPEGGISLTQEDIQLLLKLSLHPVQSFPLSVVGLNFTKFIVTALKRERLNRYRNVDYEETEETVPHDPMPHTKTLGQKQIESVVQS